jgi:dehydrogenase/reductase SDR family member 12
VQKKNLKQMGSGHSIIGTTQWYLEGSRLYGKAGFEKAATRFRQTDIIENLSDQTHVITGANSGLGFSVALELCKRRADVHILVRNKERGEKAIADLKAATGHDNITLHLVDCADEKSIMNFAEQWSKNGNKPIHSLINNAGVLLEKKELTSSSHEVTFATAILQSFLLSALLAPAVAKAKPFPGRIINISSGGMYTMAYDANDPEGKSRKYSGPQQYAVSKRAQIMLTEMWAKKLKSSGIFFASMHPGWAETKGLLSSMSDFVENKRSTLRSSEQGADTIVWLAAAKREVLNVDQNNGKFWFDREVTRTSFPFARTEPSEGDYGKLWKTCSDVSGGWTWEGSQQEKELKQ